MNKELITQSERFAKLRQQAEQAPELWQPNDGDTLIGELMGSRKVATQYGDNTQIIVKTEGGAIVCTWLTKFIADALRSQNADKGDLVAITYAGKRQSAAGKTYNSYSVVVDK